MNDFIAVYTAFGYLGLAVVIALVFILCPKCLDDQPRPDKPGRCRTRPSCWCSVPTKPCSCVSFEDKDGDR